jgi:hypothetical protein
MPAAGPAHDPGDAEFDGAAVDYEGAARPFDQVERLHVRRRLEPDLDWLDFATGFRWPDDLRARQFRKQAH